MAGHPPEREGPSLPPPSSSELPWRVEALQAVTSRNTQRLDVVEKTADKLDLEIHGERGVNATLRELSNEIKWLRRALWGLAASVTVASIVFALGTLGPH